MSGLKPVFISDLTGLQPHSCSACKALLVTNCPSHGDLERKFDCRTVAQKASSGCILFQSAQQRLKKRLDEIAVELLKLWHLENSYLILRPHVNSEGVLESLGLHWTLQEKIKRRKDDLLYPFAPTDDPSAKFVVNMPLNLDPGSCETFAWINDVLDKCRDCHTNCNRVVQENRQKFATPKRLLDVGESNDKLLHLFETSQDAHLNYAIASYAWGTGPQAEPIQQARTTQANMEARMSNGMELTSLSRTIRDLVEVSRRIGYRYLWIDALCIVQDDPIDTSDQVDTMVEFYKGADIMISAASASHSDEGFLQRRTVDKSYGNVFLLPYLWKLGNHSVQGSLLLSEKDTNCGLDEVLLDMRIWTFQEHLVCSRVVIFGSRQVRWKCKEVVNLFDGGDYCNYDGEIEESFNVAFSPPSDDEDSMQKNSRVQAWLEIVEYYSPRQYSRPADRIPAFNEAISSLAPLMGWDKSDCVEGVWKYDISRQLLWKKEKPLEGRELEHRHKYGPSWSWATLPGAVTWGHNALACRDLGDSITSVSFHKHSNEATCLVVEANIQEAYWKPHLFNPDKSSTIQQYTLAVEVAWDVETTPQMVYLLDLSQGWAPAMNLGLVLVKVVGKETLFERRGCFEKASGQQNSDQRMLYCEGGYTREKVSII